jgi:hypothetical protein
MDSDEFERLDLVERDAGLGAPAGCPCQCQLAGEVGSGPRRRNLGYPAGALLVPAGVEEEPEEGVGGDEDASGARWRSPCARGTTPKPE